MVKIENSLEDIKKLERNLLLYKIFSFNKGLIFSLPIFALYFQESGLNYLHILLVFTAQSAAQIVTEIPSGICADYFGRKKVFLYTHLLALQCFYSSY